MKVVIIDGDSIPYVAAWLNKDKDNDELFSGIDTHMIEILQNTQAIKYLAVIKNPDEKDFRRIMFSTYKANRQSSPDWYTNRKPIIVDYLFKKWNFVCTQNCYETDDVCTSVAYSLTKKGYTPIISSVDKDLRQSSGWNYNPKSKELVFITPEEAERNMLTQLLTGDSTDNIKGLAGIGPAKAKKLLDSCHDGVVLPREAIMDAYITHHGDIFKGLIDFAENILQVVMRRDLEYPYVLIDVPEHIKKAYNPEELFKAQ